MENEQGMAPLHVAAKVRVVEGGRGKSPVNREPQLPRPRMALRPR